MCHGTAYIKETPLLGTLVCPYLSLDPNKDRLKVTRVMVNITTLITEHHISNTSQPERAEQQYTSRYTRQSEDQTWLFSY